MEHLSRFGHEQKDVQPIGQPDRRTAALRSLSGALAATPLGGRLPLAFGRLRNAKIWTLLPRHEEWVRRLLAIILLFASLPSTAAEISALTS
ncbi:MAG: hypothetical protein KIS79_05395, partial [Burkholderiales bacterium]|nr:hypothetical protein [Burkholderiales bacterium]